MGITRVVLPFEGHFTQVPNSWVRDVRLSRRARGLLVELMSHRAGWHISLGSLQKAGPEGRDALRTAIGELKDAGYLKLAQSHGSSGRFNEIEYELCAPTAYGISDTGGFADDGLADVGESDTKKTNPSEDHHEGAPPKPSCQKHPDGTTQPCRACGDARRRFDAYTQAQRDKPTPTPPRSIELLDCSPGSHKWTVDGTCAICTARREDVA